MLKSLCIAFATYSRIPTPRVEWNEQSLRWAVCFFPLVGAVIAGLELLWFWLAGLLEVKTLLWAGIAAALPILVTGGIHLDGYCDTVDALSSHQTRERKLEILKDSNAGAFAVIFFGLWLLLYFCGWSCVEEMRTVLAVGISCVLSRALSGLALTNFPQARKQGMLRTVADAARKNAVTGVMAGYIVLCAAGLLVLMPLRGLLVLAVNGLALLYYRVMSQRQFGGVTGDLAGCFLSLAELGSVLILAITEGLCL